MDRERGCPLTSLEPRTSDRALVLGEGFLGELDCVLVLGEGFLGELKLVLDLREGFLEELVLVLILVELFCLLQLWTQQFNSLGRSKKPRLKFFREKVNCRSTTLS
jgi:hypothetical protein